MSLSLMKKLTSKDGRYHIDLSRRDCDGISGMLSPINFEKQQEMKRQGV